MTNTPEIGCYLDHGNYTSDELSQEIIDIAVEFGMAEPELSVPEGDDDYSEFLHDASEDAIAWLNDTARPPFTYWSNDGQAFGLWPDIDGAQEDESVHVNGPKDIYTSYILEINDHGNATLYELTRREVWSVV